jgi:cystathionine beta-synthase
VEALSAPNQNKFVYGNPDRTTSLVRYAMQTSITSIGKDMPIDRLEDRLEAEPFTAVMDGNRFLGLIIRADVLNYLRKQLNVR